MDLQVRNASKQSNDGRKTIGKDKKDEMPKIAIIRPTLTIGSDAETHGPLNL